MSLAGGVEELGEVRWAADLIDPPFRCAAAARTIRGRTMPRAEECIGMV